MPVSVFTVNKELSSPSEHASEARALLVTFGEVCVVTCCIRSKTALQMTNCSCAWAHSCKRQRLEECGCCACAFRRTTLQEEGDFDAAKEALHQHIRHLVVAGQSEAAAALAHTFEAEVRSASQLWAAGCAAMDADFALLSGGGGAEGEEEGEAEEEQEAAWATACAAALPVGVLASVAQQAVARARAAHPPLNPHGCASGLFHLPCAKCQDKCHGDARSQRSGHARLRGAAQGGAEAEEEGDDGDEGAGGEGGEHEVCILEEKTFEQRQEERLAQAKRDQRYVELSSDDDDGGGGGGRSGGGSGRGGDGQPTGRAAVPPAATELTLPRHNVRAAAAGRAAAAAEARATAAGARVAAASAGSPAVASAAAARRLPVASSRQPSPLRSFFVEQQQAILDAAHAQQQASLRASERAAVAATAEAEAAEAAEAISVTISLAAGAPAATARRGALWRAAAAGSSDEQLDRLAAAEVAAGGCGAWWGRAAEEALVCSRRCALCGRSLGDLPPVAGVGYLLEVDAAGDVIASTHVTVGEATSLLAISPPCGHPLHQLCARTELRRLNMPEPAVDGAAVGGSGAVVDLGAASERATRPSGIALLWRCPHQGCSTQER